MAQVVVPSRLISLLSSWGADPDTVAAAATDVVARYGEPHRHYHTVEHVDYVLAVTDQLGATDEVTCAVWMHDVIYDPRRSDNEARSAVFSQGLLASLGAPDQIVREVARLVMSTAHHDPDEGDVNGQVLADADLAILGAPTDRYRRYVREVRAEYAHVSEDDWRTGRAAVVKTFLDRRRLFHARSLRESREAQARDNLRTELVALTTPQAGGL